jgi:hypothetical protein
MKKVKIGWKKVKIGWRKVKMYVYIYIGLALQNGFGPTLVCWETCERNNIVEPNTTTFLSFWFHLIAWVVQVSFGMSFLSSLPLICSPNFSFMGEAGDRENNSIKTWMWETILAGFIYSALVEMLWDNKSIVPYYWRT